MTMEEGDLAPSELLGTSLPIWPPEFRAWPKTPRLQREVIVTEKIDGTNSVVCVSDDGNHVIAGSRTRWITPESDNFGFAKWVQANKDELLKLGPGSHFGEWYGAGIQRGYGLKEKRFALFNVSRWGDVVTRPICCGVVPVLWRGVMRDCDPDTIIYDLQVNGSRMVPGYMKPEGIVLFHTKSGQMYKQLIENDASPKGE